MRSRLRFFDLPCELRDIIYHRYLYDPGGYHHDYDSGKLRRSDGSRIDLALSYSCKKVASEMRNLALNLNVVTFKTTDSERDRLKAGLFHILLCFFDETNTRLFVSLGHRLSTQLREELISSSPGMEDLFLLSNITGLRYLCFPQSTMRQRLCHLVKLITKRFDPLPPILPGWRLHMRIPLLHSSFSSMVSEPWSIPTESDLKAVHVAEEETWDPNWKRVAWRFSAAAVAIKFLHAMPKTSRGGMRRIVLDEDQVSIAYSSSHGLGIVQFCRENPHLHVERRVNLWQNVLMPQSSMKEGLSHPLIKVPSQVRPRCDLNRVHSHFYDWIEETLALPAAGMPDGSFSLVFDGDPLPERSSLAFEALKQAAALQQAQKQWMSTWGRRDVLLYSLVHSPESPQAVADITQGRGLITCNFPVGDDMPVIVESVQQMRPVDSRSHFWSRLGHICEDLEEQSETRWE